MRQLASLNITRLGVIGLGVVLFACQPQASIQEQLDAKRTELATLQNEIHELEGQDDSPKEIAKTKVGVRSVSTEDFTSYFKIHGIVKTNKNVSVVPETSGQIKSIKVREGQYVKKGSVLAILDTQILYSNLQELEKSYELAVDLFKKQENLRKEDIGTEIQFLEAKNRKESLERSIASLKTQIGKAHVKAPISGTIDKIFPNVGEMASPSMPIVRVVNLDNVYIETEVSEVYLGRVNTKEKVQVSFPSIGDTTLGTISYVGNYINPSNRTFHVHIQLPKSKNNYVPNLLAKVRFRDLEAKDVITVPSNVIHDNGKSYFVFVNNGGLAKKQIIQTGTSYNNKTIVKSGLKEGDQIIVEGHTLVVEDAKISID